jgi:hypothetical protein
MKPNKNPLFFVFFVFFEGFLLGFIGFHLFFNGFLCFLSEFIGFSMVFFGFCLKVKKTIEKLMKTNETLQKGKKKTMVSEKIKGGRTSFQICSAELFQNIFLNNVKIAGFTITYIFAHPSPSLTFQTIDVITIDEQQCHEHILLLRRFMNKTNYKISKFKNYETAWYGGKCESWGGAYHIYICSDPPP